MPAGESFKDDREKLPIGTRVMRAQTKHDSGRRGTVVGYRTDKIPGYVVEWDGEILRHPTPMNEIRRAPEGE